MHTPHSPDQNNGQEEEKDVYRWHEHGEKAAERKKAIETKVKRAAGLKGRTEKQKRDKASLPRAPPRPHKKGKPRNLLAPTASRHQAITESNALVSKLLGLPPEIRTRIWCYVLGGRTVHISVPVDDQCSVVSRDAMEQSCCTSHEDPIGTIVNLRRADTLTEKQDYLATHEVSCWGPQRERLDLGVLSVCRQLHQEAVLLPYQENTFVVAISALRPLLLSLMATQSNAITSLVLITEEECEDEHPCNPMSTAVLNTRLSSLQKFHVLAFFMDAPDLDKMWRRQVGAYISLTRRLRLQIVDAAVAWYSKVPLDRGVNRVEMTGWKAWSARMEKQLKTPFDEAAVEEVREDKAEERTRRREETSGARGLRAFKA
ncbi:hypothetical protein LTR56_027696 [Elasticomyces elasticus]|nr:hypothetical protein LTR56_027696 [Elasticomyces elasticus]KAK3614138.1 hypothetical protein LTR22_027885 [Elasticomyces elasticus]KAK4894650.1 hypothetical protein LTR49_028364 [Elasticomyces elasticus]KAK5723088.1 hypothetical protein LTS12_027539 [Elasticomyces elasticus]